MYLVADMATTDCYQDAHPYCRLAGKGSVAQRANILDQLLPASG